MDKLPQKERFCQSFRKSSQNFQALYKAYGELCDCLIRVSASIVGHPNTLDEPADFGSLASPALCVDPCDFADVQINEWRRHMSVGERVTALPWHPQNPGLAR